MRSYEMQVKSTCLAFAGEAELSSYIGKIAGWLRGGKRNSLVLFGRVGAGKSTMLRSIQKAVDAIRASAAAELKRTNPAFFDNYGLQAEYESLAKFPALLVVSAIELARDIDPYKTQAFLAVDDLGCEPATKNDYGTVSAPMVDLLMFRYEHKLPTIITTNLDSTDIEKRYGERIMDRLAEDYDWLGFTNPSYRRKK